MNEDTTSGRKISRRGHEEVEKLPRVPVDGSSYWLNSSAGARINLTHQLFRFPARIHAPVIRWALGRYGRKGSMVLDPFTGSGSVQVECAARGISSVGIDIDPLACRLSRVKANPLAPRRLQRAFAKIKELLAPHRQRHADREVRAGADISENRFERELHEVSVPPIPNIQHWFRRYVITDLARVFAAVEAADLSPRETDFFRVCAAATIRRVCNADPTPVSGLEVTHVQAEINRTRRIKVFDEFFGRVQLAVDGMVCLHELWRRHTPVAKARVIQANVVGPKAGLTKTLKRFGQFPLVITSPPYCNAVEYSRRHRLEMYWLGFVDSSESHGQLAHSYIGRQRVRLSDWDGDAALPRSLERLMRRIGERNHIRARAVRHYFFSMQRFFGELSTTVRARGSVVCILGDSVCAGIKVPTAKYVTELASGLFELTTSFSYALRNHYMQYGLRNGEGIKREHVLVFRKRR